MGKSQETTQNGFFWATIKSQMMPQTSAYPTYKRE